MKDAINFDISIIDDNLFNYSSQVVVSATLRLFQNYVILSGLGDLLSKQYNILIRDNEFDYFTIPLANSPELSTYKSNTWDEKKWTEVDVALNFPIRTWSIQFTWIISEYSCSINDRDLSSFHVASPSGTEMAIIPGCVNRKDIWTSPNFNGEPAKGIWRLWIEDKVGYGFCQAVNVSMNIVGAKRYMTVKVPERVFEGIGQVTGLLQAIPPPEKDMCIYLSTSDSNKAVIQSTITIPGGIDNMQFDFSIVDDSLLSISSSIQIIASAPDYYTGIDHLIIDDNESAVLSIVLPYSATEGDQHVQGIIQISQPVDFDVDIPLISSEKNIITVPESVKVPKGLSEVNFIFTINELSVAQSVTISASVPNWKINNGRINVFPIMISESERKALIDLYNSTDGANWKNSENWLGQHGTECSWFGVDCDVSEKHIIGLSIENNDLNGDILPSINSLQNLSGLNLPGNQLSSLPESFGDLQSLSYLDLSGNQLSSLPESFGDLQSLSSLYLSGNQLSSLPESFGNLISLYTIDLNNNKLSSLPENFGYLTKLLHLYINNNQLKSLPDSFGYLQNLIWLFLDNNQLITLPDSFGNCKKLMLLYLVNNQLRSLPDSFGNLINLYWLYLSNNQLVSVPKSFENAQELLCLDLSNNELRSLPNSFGNFINLDELYLSNNQLVDLPKSFENFQQLEKLDLSKNQLIYLADSFGNFQNLVELNLSNNQLLRLPETFGNQVSLSNLNLSNNKLATLSENFVSLLQLSKLDLSINQLEKLPQNFEQLVNIDYLDISTNHLKLLPTDIGNMAKLNYLNISKNEIQILPESIGHCYLISLLNLSYNNIELIPSSIGNLKILQEVNFSNNKIKELPESMKNLSNLQKIDSSNNSIEIFPYQLSNIDNLHEINLSENNITNIDDNIQNFNKLLILDLSGNKLKLNISSKIGSLINLQSLNLSNCTLSNSNIPEELFNLNNLRYLSLNDNSIENIPENIGNLKNLITLSLANNRLLDNIDKPLFNLINLRSLDLSGNKSTWNEVPMYGDIPVEFSKLTKLVYLDLSGTELFTTSSNLEKFIIKISPNWINPKPKLIERSELCIHYITTSSDHLGYSLHTTIPILIVMTQPVSLTGGNLIVSLETGEVDQEIHIPPFALSYTAIANYTVHEGDFSEDLNVKTIRLSEGASLTNENGEAVDLTLIPEINLAVMKNIYVDGTIPEIEITEPTDPCVEQFYKIKGTATDISKDFSVTLTIINQQDGTKSQYLENFTNNTTVNWEFSPTYTWQNNTTYTIQIDVKDFAGNTKTLSRSVTIGKKPSTITTHLSQNNIIFGQSIKITGNISPPEDVFGKEVTLELISPSGKEPKVVNAKEDGSFEYALKCGDIDEAGLWQIVATWEGTSCLNPANSLPQTLNVKKASCTVALDATELSVKLGDQVSITGKVIPEIPCTAHLANIPVNLLVTGPGGINEIELQTLETGSFIQKNFTGFDTLGEWQIAASVKNNSYTSSFSNIIQINVVETAGYAIIVQGKIAGEEGLESHNKTANDVYHHLKQRGLLDDDILYFNFDTDQASYKITDTIINQLNNADVPAEITERLKDIRNIEFSTKESFIDQLTKLDEQILQYQSEILSLSKLPIEIDGLPTQNAIQKAITEDMPVIMKDQPANLYIVMVDHGTEDTFYINPDATIEDERTISDDELNDWLTELENTAGWNQEIIVMLGFCFSGSFIDELSKPNRIIIASAGPDEFSYKGPLDQDGIREGEFFISEFFKSIARGKDIKESFSEAVIQTEIFTAKGEGSVNAPPYFDNSAQHPLLDDNGDKMGSNNVIDTATDGKLAEQIIIGVSSLTMNDPGDVIITHVSDAIFLGTDETTTDQLWAKVNDSDRLLTLWLEIKPPGFVPNEVGSGQVEMDLPKKVTLSYNDITKAYHWDSSDFDNTFVSPGTYHIYYFAKDTISRNVSPMKESIVYKASAVNHPPEAFDLVSPANDITITTSGVISSLAADPTADAYTMIAWEKTTDPDNDYISYTLLLKKDNKQFDEAENRMIIQNIDNNFYEINLSASWDGATVYWKVQAIDNYGAIRESDIHRFYINNAHNPSNGTLWGYVFDDTTKAAISMATIRVSAGGRLVKQITSSETDGLYFEAFKPLSNYKIEVQKEGYISEVRTPVNVPEDQKCQQNFNLKRDNSTVLVISHIPSQTIDEGETFAYIALDTTISVSNVDKDQINWTYSGTNDLMVSIDSNRNAIVIQQDENWHGAEEITFYAEAPDQNKVSASAVFTVRPVNDPPEVHDIPDQTIFDVSTFQTIQLDQYVDDIDNAYTEITWSAKGQQKLTVSITNRMATISVSDISWVGYEDITFTATDPSGESGEKIARFTVAGNNGKPVISLNDPLVVQINQNEKFIEPGYVAVDGVDGNITDSVTFQSDVNTQTPGIYHITYYATNSTGNLSEPADRIVIVNKTQFPIQKISGNITDDNNAPVGGVDVVLTGQGETYETTSYYHGYFELLIPITFDGSPWQMSLSRQAYYEKTLEFSSPPTFDTIILFRKDSHNASVIKGQCFSYHVDGSTPVLPEVTLRARATDDDTVIATGLSDNNGQYTLAVDVRDRAYTFEAVKYGYETQSFDSSSASRIVLVPLTTLIVEQPDSTIEHNTARNLDRVSIVISAKPPFSDKTNELTVNLSTENSERLTIGKNYIETDHTYKLDYPKYDDFTINLRADTTEDQDATNGYFVEQTLSFQSIEASAQVDVTKGETDYQVTQPFYVEQSDLSSFMMIDRGGLSGLDMPKKLNYTIRNYTFSLDRDLSDHVVEFELKDSFGQKLKIIENSICLGIGFEPPVTREKLENQTYQLIHSETVADLLKGQGEIESSFSIFEKHVTFCTSHMSAFGFRENVDIEQQAEKTDSGDSSGGGCFLESILNWGDIF
ncbi:MAG: DUF5011 domain-containing protein [Candidatus Magnetomorum sp.]|nr:DUF5011 domain-containing protein [Candidatus Magnetomorum sp.]